MIESKAGISREVSPKATESEHALIVALACEPHLFSLIGNMTPDYFLNRECENAFSRMVEIRAEGRRWFPEDFSFSFVNAPLYDLFPARVRETIARVRDAHIARQGYSIAKSLAVAADQQDTQSLLEILSNSTLPDMGSDDIPASVVASEVWEQIGNDEDDIVKTGFLALDSVGALRKQELLVLAARPSVGKSQLVFQIAHNNAKAGHIVLIASLEMSRQQVVTRIAQVVAGASLRSKDEFGQSKIAMALADLMMLDKLIIIDEPTTSFNFLNRARSVASNHGRLDLIISDHLRLFTDTHSAERHRLGQISANHRNMAHEFNCPVLLCAQLNRGVESREDKRPGLVDLRDSGEIEENADVVAFIYREDYYKHLRKGGSQSGIAQLYAGKNRNGELWMVRLYFNAEKGPRFTDLQYGEQRDR